MFGANLPDFQPEENILLYKGGMRSRESAYTIKLRRNPHHIFVMGIF